MPSSTHEYLTRLAALRGDAILVTTMTAAKIWPQIEDGVLDFNYLPSAMSHAADIALGMALAVPRRLVICVNGDGSLVMNLGGLVTAADAGAANLRMLVMDNGVYEVVGGGRIPGAGRTDYAALAAACGWPTAMRFSNAQELADGWATFAGGPGPALAVLTTVDPPGTKIQLPARHPRQALRDLRAFLTGERTV
ncbi:MAG: thiamine pyrophosphate-dependent enzyme [Pirellulales bacterium]